MADCLLKIPTMFRNPVRAPPASVTIFSHPLLASPRLQARRAGTCYTRSYPVSFRIVSGPEESLIRPSKPNLKPSTSERCTNVEAFSLT